MSAGRGMFLQRCIRQAPKTKRYTGPQVIPMWQVLTIIQD